MSSIVFFQNVGLRYGTGGETLSDIDVALAAGSFTIVTGPSGAGKTSLLRLATMAIPPSRGIVRLFDAEPAGGDKAAHVAMRRRIGIVHQDCRLVPHLTVAENVALPLHVRGTADSAVPGGAVAEMLAWVGMADRGDALPHVLSDGERRRVAVARAVVTSPELIVADEPMPPGDVETTGRLLPVFEAAHRMGTTILIATRDASLVTRVPGAIPTRLMRGRIEDATGLLRHPPASRTAYR